MNEKLFKTAAAEDDINIDKVVKYIHNTLSLTLITIKYPIKHLWMIHSIGL